MKGIDTTLAVFTTLAVLWECAIIVLDFSILLLFINGGKHNNYYSFSIKSIATETRILLSMILSSTCIITSTTCFLALFTLQYVLNIRLSDQYA